MKVTATHTLGDLRRDCTKIASRTKPKMTTIVKRKTEQGNRLAQRFARERSGPHGAHYWKRISGEMLSPLTGEYGLDATGPPVGAGWRNGPPNTDLPRSADIQGPRLQADAAKLLDRAFWP